MSDLTLRKTSPTGNDMKSTAQGTTLKQQGFHEVNKRRTFLQDNSWIKERPEEEKDENYARVVLHRRNSHDASDRKTNERDEPKATITWYRSDGTLDRTSDRNDAAKTYKANTLDNRLTNRNTSTFRSPEETKMQPGGLFSANATNTPASNSATTPVKKKRQSWFPPPPPGYKAAPSTGASGREPTVHPPIPPKPSSSVSSPNQLRQDNRQICPPKPSAYTETNRSAERNIRSQDLENVVKVDTSFQKADKGPKSLENLLVVNTRTDKDGKGGEDLDNVIKVNPKESENTTGKQDLDGLIKVNPETNKNIKRGQCLDNLIKVTPEVNRSNPGGQSLDNLIEVAPETNRTNQGSEQDLDELINVSPKAVKNTAGNQDLDKLIKVNPETLSNNQRNRDLNNLIKVNPEVIRSNQRDQDLENLIEVNSNMSKSKNERQDGQVSGSTEALISPSSRTTAYSYEARKALSSNAETRHAGPKGTVVYTRTYVENSKSPKDRYQEGISGKYIQTIYSTSDRSVIEMDMCTYCRKPLGTEAKMILNELQICCHSTCFKCEICKQPLENLQAGDSIWIYRQTIHCEHCYSQVVAKWIQ
ncbi:sciellin isoform X10 [Balaenoptera acutorostrata]|uniref:Sciellin isoform X10 n=1 Tax=Balaenoptera acutorostrata TaxID=9767 RepID=A0A384AG30_BALAC|nr:sciellin isoform X10 [Balaenoptera acutorostrata]XP_057388533.1 sciellin isoform X10 [Balaenoptera acutorostrata]XP_057388534.1 sciellin isoform X10 [Balaenoptera acutorostrata]XP_057388535.1 sciellin isoform X10 [Balaenoptera acutorostrata]XP_057388536.1 sciellin isoform X10 [Balaenoptera acutorostrata]